MPGSFRLMTVNLLHERCDASDFARVVDELDPDVVVAQEVGPHCADVLASKYPYHRLRPALGFLGRGVATRFEGQFGEIDMSVRPGTWAKLDIGGRPVMVGGVHLYNPINFPWWRSVRERGRQLDGLFDWLDGAGGLPLLVAGDFNASPIWPAYKRVAGRLTDLVADWSDRNDRSTESTWGWRPGWPKMLRIDHVFGRGVEASHVRVEPVRGTDHAAVVVDLSILPGT